MSTDQLLEIVKRRGLKIVLRDARPVLIRNPRDPSAVTDRLLAVLSRHRETIIAMLIKQGDLFPCHPQGGASH